MGVLKTLGVQSEANLPFSDLHQLLRLLADRFEFLPEPQRDALLAAFGIAEAAARDSYLTSLATLNSQLRRSVPMPRRHCSTLSRSSLGRVDELEERRERAERGVHPESGRRQLCVPYPASERQHREEVR
jgi:hypothetical protein